MYLVTVLVSLVNSEMEGLAFFTCWGMITTGATFILLSVAAVKDMRKKSYIFNYYSPMLLEKWIVMLFEISITFEAVITIVFWALIFPYFKY